MKRTRNVVAAKLFSPSSGRSPREHSKLMIWNPRSSASRIARSDRP
jgi:hypothetical protein